MNSAGAGIYLVLLLPAMRDEKSILRAETDQESESIIA
jgi:hypothetical protein